MSNTIYRLSSDRLLKVLSLSQNATAIYVSDDIIIQFANDAMTSFWGKGKDLIGMKLEDVLPELKGQPFIEMLQRVWREGITISGTDTPAMLEIDGKLQKFYYDFKYRAIKDESGNTYCILHTATDVTERFLGKRREEGLTRELHDINEELSSANEELMASNEELYESQKKLRELYENLIESDTRFRNMVKQAPVGMCIIRAEDLVVQEVNDAYLLLVGKTRTEMEHKVIWNGVPETAAFYRPVMNKVISTGVAFVAKEHELMLIRDGIPEIVIVDFVYEPVKHFDGTIDAIMVLIIDVTSKVIARKSIEEMEERVRLAVESAEIGTFDLDILSERVLTSQRFNEIFGLDHWVPRDEVPFLFHPDDRGHRLRALEEAYENGKLFYEARILHSDNTVRWVRAQGKVFYHADGSPSRLLGTLLDITHFKHLQQQKDDFISIASHELKTPITSLKASLQLLERMKDNPSPGLFPRLIEQSTRSMQKISTLVDDLLNVSRTNESELQLNKTTFDIRELLSTCCNHVRVAGKYELIIQGDEALRIHGDEHGIDQVVVNLVNNAVKYAPDSMKIYLIVENLGNEARISVKDSGPGIPADKLAHLFDRYYQVDATGFKSAGLGLGLYISAEIIRRHGGKMGVSSELGKGSTFWFTLPL